MKVKDFINSIPTKIFSRLRSSMGDAECRRYLREHLNSLGIEQQVLNWVKYDFNDINTRPKKAGKYLIHRAKCGKTHFEQWNGSGWASSNNDCTHYCVVEKPKT